MKAPSYRRPTPGIGKPFECHACGKRLHDQRSLRQHVAAAHPVQPSPGGPEHLQAGEARA